MHPVLSRVPVAVTEEAQTFVLPAHAPPGRYLRITLHGRQQMQLEDGRYYVAIRCVCLGYLVWIYIGVCMLHSVGCMVPPY